MHSACAPQPHFPALLAAALLPLSGRRAHALLPCARRTHLADGADALVRARRTRPLDLRRRNRGGGRWADRCPAVLPRGRAVQSTTLLASVPAHVACSAISRDLSQGRMRTAVKLPACAARMAPAATSALSRSSSIDGNPGLRCMPCQLEGEPPVAGVAPGGVCDPARAVAGGVSRCAHHALAPCARPSLWSYVVSRADI